MLKSLLATSSWKGQQLNLTLWCVVDVTYVLDKLCSSGGQKKSVKSLVDKEFGYDFMNSFDLVFDLTQFSNVNGLGFSHKFLQSQDNYMMEVFIKHMDKGFEASSAVAES